MSSTPLLEGYGIRLEPLGPQHVAALTPIALDATNWRYMTLRIETPADVEKLVADGARNAEAGTMETWVDFVGDEAVGASSFFDINTTHRTAEIGFTWIAKVWRGSGVNPRVKLLQLTYAFEVRGMRRIALKTHHDNLHSQHAILKLGAQFEGTFRNHMIMPDGSTRHTKWYSITAEEWPAVKQQLLDRIAVEPLQKAER